LIGPIRKSNIWFQQQREEEQQQQVEAARRRAEEQQRRADEQAGIAGLWFRSASAIAQFAFLPGSLEVSFASVFYTLQTMPFPISRSTTA